MASTSFNFTPDQHPLWSLPPEDLDLIAALVLRSGSLKALAEAYRVSYPTIRARLDRVIERLEAAMQGRTGDAMSDLLADLVEQGQLAPGAARRIRDLHRRAGATEAPRAPEQERHRGPATGV